MLLKSIAQVEIFVKNYLFERVAERGVLHSLGHSLSAHNGQELLPGLLY